MSTKYFIPLQEIDKSIRINCQIDHKAFKHLTLTKEGGAKNQGIGRRLFIYVALKAGYDQEQICDYLCITTNEFDNKVKTLNDFYRTGKYLFLNRMTDNMERDESCLLFYRKLVLVGNYLRFRYNFDV